MVPGDHADNESGGHRQQDEKNEPVFLWGFAAMARVVVVVVCCLHMKQAR